MSYRPKGQIILIWPTPKPRANRLYIFLTYAHRVLPTASSYALSWAIPVYTCFLLLWYTCFIVYCIPRSYFCTRVVSIYSIIGIGKYMCQIHMDLCVYLSLHIFVFYLNNMKIFNVFTKNLQCNNTFNCIYFL